MYAWLRKCFSLLCDCVEVKKVRDNVVREIEKSAWLRDWIPHGASSWRECAKFFWYLNAWNLKCNDSWGNAWERNPNHFCMKQKYVKGLHGCLMWVLVVCFFSPKYTATFYCRYCNKHRPWYFEQGICILETPYLTAPAGVQWGCTPEIFQENSVTPTRFIPNPSGI